MPSGYTVIGDLPNLTQLNHGYVYADGFAGGTFAEKVNAAIAYLDGDPGIVDATGLQGVQEMSEDVAIPIGLKLRLGPVELSGDYGFILAVAAGNMSAQLEGMGRPSHFTYTGTGDAISTTGTPVSVAGIEINDLWVTGTEDGANGIHLGAFNGAGLRNVMVNNFLTGNGVLLEGTNTVTIIKPDIAGNLHGLRKQPKVIESAIYAANAVTVLGGYIITNTGWGVWEDANATDGFLHYNGRYFGVTFENNGTTASPADAGSGHAFIQRSNLCLFSGCYFEQNSVAPDNAIVIGNDDWVSRGTRFRDCWFGSIGATNTINNYNGQRTTLSGVKEDAEVTNFILNGALSSQIGIDRSCEAPSATNFFAGSDSGLDADIDNQLAVSNINARGTTLRGYGFNSISGKNQTLRIRARASDSLITRFDDEDGIAKVNVHQNGDMDIDGDVYFPSGTALVWNNDSSIIRLGADSLKASGAFTAGGLLTGVGINSTNGYQVSGAPGVNGSFTTVDGKTVAVSKGIITSIT